MLLRIMNIRNSARPILLAAAFFIGAWLVLGSAANAALITNGFTFAVASDGSDNSIGNHFHSNTSGVFGNIGKAEVGRFGSEEVRGLSEYDLTSLSNSPSAFLSFEVFNEGGLFAGMNDFPFDGSIIIDAYAGNNLEDISAYQAASIATVGSFLTSGLVVGNTLSFDVTTIFNNLIASSAASLGIRLAAVPLPDRSAWAFDNFRLITENLTTPTNSVPESATVALLVAGLVGLGLMAAGAGTRPFDSDSQSVESLCGAGVSSHLPRPRGRTTPICSSPAIQVLRPRILKSKRPIIRLPWSRAPCGDRGDDFVADIEDHGAGGEA